MATKERIQNGFLPAKGALYFTLLSGLHMILGPKIPLNYTTFSAWTYENEVDTESSCLKWPLQYLFDRLQLQDLQSCMTVMTLNNFNTFTSDWVSFSSLFLWCLLRSSFSSLSSYSLQQWNFSDSKVSVVADVAKLWIKRSHAKPSLDENMRQKSLDYITRRQRESLAMVIIKKSFGSFCNPKLNQFVADRLHSVIIIESWHQ